VTSSFKINLKGQIPSGKNQMKIDPRSGRHYPAQRFELWRQDAWAQIMTQRKKIEVPCCIRVDYWPGDRRRRDVPGCADALCHLLEMCGIVEDDSLLEDWEWHTHEVSPQNPRTIITLVEKIARG
jgi:Holliday junction resolvase RusA-like endonuclease